jgi:hypothetical protein
MKNFFVVFLFLFFILFFFFHFNLSSDEIKVGFILATEKEERYKKDKMFF